MLNIYSVLMVISTTFGTHCAHCQFHFLYKTDDFLHIRIKNSIVFLLLLVQSYVKEMNFPHSPPLLIFCHSRQSSLVFVMVRISCPSVTSVEM